MNAADEWEESGVENKPAVESVSGGDQENEARVSAVHGRLQQ